jgi:hypothetical protein
MLQVKYVSAVATFDKETSCRRPGEDDYDCGPPGQLEQTTISYPDKLK